MGIAYPPAPMDKTTVRMTIMSLAIALGAVVAILFIMRPFGILCAESAVVVATVAAIIVRTWLTRPLGYEVSEDSVRVRRWCWPFGVVNIPLSGLHEVREVLPDGLPFRRMWRIWAAGRCFGYFGTFWLRGFGFFWMSCTNRDKMVLLRNRRKFILSPASPGEFVDEVKRRAGIA